MNNITIIVPIHKLDDELMSYLKDAMDSVKDNRKTYTEGELPVLFVVSKDVDTNLISNLIDNSKIITNEGKTDFCSQINYAVDFVENDMFSILEMDDIYTKKWFKTANEYYEYNKDVSVFLPVNVIHDSSNYWSYGNEMVLATSFSNEIGMIDFDCLKNCTSFNLTGGIFNKNDFIKIGKLKSSIAIAFNYEFLLRITSKKLKVMVVPKEGYHHVINRKDSLTDIYNRTIDSSKIKDYFSLAKKEYKYKEDRLKDISNSMSYQNLK